MVGQFVQADPGRRGRARLDLYRLARHFHGRALLFVTHSWGGGIQRHIDDMIARLKAEGTAVVPLSVDRTRNTQVRWPRSSRSWDAALDPRAFASGPALDRSTSTA